MSYPALCTGCNRYVYETATSPPCPHCFPGGSFGQTMRALRLATVETAATVEDAAERLEEIFA